MLKLLRQNLWWWVVPLVLIVGASLALVYLTAGADPVIVTEF